MKQIVFAGGCFWGVESYFDNLKGVISTNVGYANGDTVNPTYEEICQGFANHSEAVEINYDSNQITLVVLLEHLFRIINPYSINKQGNDVGIQYRSGIYYKNKSDLEIINNFINEKQSKTDKKIVIEVLELENYYKAEDYHQDYLLKNPQGYCHIDLNLIKEDEKK